MALPFYNEADQAIYEGGQHFIPQEKYRLNYTPPAIMGQNTNTGLASTNVARPYKWPYPWPPQGGGEGAGNISGTQQRSWSPNQNLGPTNITDYEAEAYGVGPTWGGTWARAQDLYSKLPTPTNLLRRGWKGIQRWREKREIANEQKLQNEIAAHNQAAYYSGAQNRQAAADQSRIDRAYREETGGQAGSYAPGGGSGEHAADPSGSTYSDPFDPGGGEKEGGLIRKAQGGRIGYREGDPVIPEDENEDIYRFMQDQGIPIGEQVEAEITEEQKAMVLDMLEKGMDMETIISITGVGQEDIMSLMGGTSMAPEDQGLASLV